MEVARVDHVSRNYKTGAVETPALTDVSLTIEEGEFAALVGPSGSGKTTLLQLLGCLDQPTSGRVFVAGQDVTGLGRDQRADIRRQRIGFIFQFFALIPTLTAYENVEMPLLLSGGSAADRDARVKALLDMIGLGARARHRPDQLSGGEQQRVAIARALAKKPAFILADEPTANLDTENGRQIMSLMARLNRETGVTFVFATHDPRVIAYARRIVALRDGGVASDAAATPTGELAPAVP